MLKPLLAADAILCTDGAAAYTIVAKNIGVMHHPVNLVRGIRVVRGAYHIQNVNAYDSRLKQWLARFGNNILLGMCLRAALGKERHFQQVTAT